MVHCSEWNQKGRDDWPQAGVGTNESTTHARESGRRSLHRHRARHGWCHILLAPGRLEPARFCVGANRAYHSHAGRAHAVDDHAVDTYQHLGIDKAWL